MATPDPVALYPQIRTPVANLGLTVFDGQVPGKVPTDANGYVLPYVAIYAGIGGDLPFERDLTSLIDTGVLDWPFQTTCVGASAMICMAIARDVTRALTNLPVAGGFVKPSQAAVTSDVPLADNQVTPARFFLPLPWRLITT